MEKQFAALKIPDSPDKILTRAISFSELPTCRRIIIQQAENNGVLVRQYSCEQIYDKLSNTKRVNFLSSVTSKLNTKDAIFKSNLKNQDNTGWHRRIPSLTMDLNNRKKSIPTIELNHLKITDDPSPKKAPISPRRCISSQELDSRHKQTSLPFSEGLTRSKEIMDLTKDDSDESEIIQIKNKIRPLKKTSEISKAPSRTNLVRLTFFTLISIAVVIISTLITEFNQKPFDFTNTSLKLREKVFGQNEAIEELINYFEINNDNFTVIMMIGGTGVGKTYTANIMKDNFPYKYNIFEYYPPIDKEIPGAYDVLSHLHCNLLIIDNLRINDANEFVKFTRFLQNQEKRPCVIIFGILNPEIIDDQLVRTMDLNDSVNNMKNVFENEKINGIVIRFKLLSSEAIDDCIMREVKDSDVVLTDNDYQEVKRQLLMANSGCKGAHAKVNLFGKKQEVLRTQLGSEGAKRDELI